MRSLPRARWVEVEYTSVVGVHMYEYWERRLVYGGLCGYIFQLLFSKSTRQLWPQLRLQSGGYFREVDTVAKPRTLLVESALAPLFTPY